jgi:hypothetical protein
LLLLLVLRLVVGWVLGVAGLVERELVVVSGVGFVYVVDGWCQSGCPVPGRLEHQP